MRRPGIGTVLINLVPGRSGAPHSALLPVPADPVSAFIAAADSVARNESDAGLSNLIPDNSALADPARRECSRVISACE